jgi:hypothetical protein
MPVLRGPLQAEGALVDVLVGWSAVDAQKLRNALRPIPPAVGARTILDTGAEITCVDSALIQTLGLPFGGLSPANLPAHGGMALHAMYDASLTVLHPSGNPRDHLLVRNLKVLEISLAPLGYEVLIGRDVLSFCRFLFNGTANRFTLAY